MGAKWYLRKLITGSDGDHDPQVFPRVLDLHVQPHAGEGTLYPGMDGLIAAARRRRNNETSTFPFSCASGGPAASLSTRPDQEDVVHCVTAARLQGIAGAINRILRAPAAPDAGNFWKRARARKRAKVPGFSLENLCA